MKAFTDKDYDYRKEFNYKGFEIVITKILRPAFGGRRHVQDAEKYGLTGVKLFTIHFKGQEREEEFKSVPQCKKFIDEGRLNYWVSIIK